MRSSKTQSNYISPIIALRKKFKIEIFNCKMNLKEPLNLKRLFPLIILAILNLTALLISGSLSAQTKATDTVLQQPTLQDCIQYALQHNPDLQNAKIDEAITETTIKSKLADWYPQVEF